jgi:hypothetical protein
MKKVKQIRKSGCNSGGECMLPASKSGAGDEIRTRDLLLGKQTLYH